MEPDDIPPTKGEAIVVREVPNSVYYDAAESRFYFYDENSRSDGRAGCSSASIVASIPEDFRGDYWQLQPRSDCGRQALARSRMDGAQALSFATDEQWPVGWTVVHQAGLALGAEFAGSLPATEIAMFSMKDLRAEVFRTRKQNSTIVAALVLTEVDSGRELKLLRAAGGGYEVASSAQKIPPGLDAEQITVVRWSESEVFVAFNDAPPSPGGQLQAAAYAVIAAPDLARKLGGRPMNVPLTMRMVAYGSVSIEEGGEEAGEQDAQDGGGFCMSHDDTCLCLDPDALCLIATFPYIMVLWMDAFSD
ncbi:MAG: hypothetical protein NXI24_08735 [bacterium]|nr:hypothetical protein [bacterium]